MELSSKLGRAEPFDYMARFSNTAEWDPGVRSAEDLSGEMPALGSAYRLLLEGTKKGIPLTYKIIEITTPSRVVLLGENSVVRSRDTIEVASTPEGGSLLRYPAELSGRGLFVLAEPLLASAFVKMGRRAEASLASVIAT